MKLEQKPSIRQHGFGKKRFQNFNKKTEEKTDLTKLPKATYSYSLICFIIIALLAVITVAAINLNSAYTTVSASFSEIADGGNPDGSPFDIYEVLDEEVLTAACEKLDNTIDPETLKKHLSVTGITTDGTFSTIKQNVLDGNATYSYFPSRYAVTYSIVSDSIKADGLFASIAAVFKQFTMPSKTEILQAVAESYQEYYKNKYVVSNGLFEVDWSKTKSLDYFNRAEEMRNIVNRMSRYLEKRYNEDVEYVSKDGVSFGDLNAEAAGIIQNDIEPYQAFVIQNGITVDKNNLLRQLQYVADTNYEQASRSRGEYSIMLDGISIYDPSVTKVVFIPALDSENEFYMNRTKIGIDYLTENASKANLAGDEAENEAHYYEYLMDQFGTAANSEEWILNLAEERCNEVIAKIDDFSKRAAAVNQAYINRVSYDGVEVSEIGYGQGIIPSVVAIIKMTAVWTSLFYVLWFFYSVTKRKKKPLKEEVSADVNP